MMEKELAGSNSSLSSSYRQWAAVSANLLPICLIVILAVLSSIRMYLGEILKLFCIDW